MADQVIVQFGLEVRRNNGDPGTLALSLGTGGAVWTTDGPTPEDDGLLLTAIQTDGDVGISTFQVTGQVIEIWLARLPAPSAGFSVALWLSLPAGTGEVSGIAHVPDDLTVLGSVNGQPQMLLSHNWTLPVGETDSE